MLTVEDGAGLADAESYASLATIAAYAVAHGKTFSISGDDEAKAEAAARNGTRLLDAMYRSRFPGRKTNGRDQAKEWPRLNAYDNQTPPDYIEHNEIPQEIIDACCELAIYEKANPGELSPEVVPGEITKRLKVGSYEEEYFGGNSGVGGQRAILIAVDDILGSLLSINRGPALFGRAERT
jgi:hypothetical protein